MSNSKRPPQTLSIIGSYAVIRTTGEIEEVQISRDFRWELEDIQEIVGGYFEPLYQLEINKAEIAPPAWGAAPAVMLVDEEGLLKHYPLNESASRIAGFQIVGDVILTPVWTVE